MRVIVFGGAGDVGSRAVEDLALKEDVEQVTIADRAEASARRVAAALGNRGARVDVARVDARDHEGLVAAMRGYDVAASALGPFYEYETRLVRAAIEAGVDYASVCDDWTAAMQVLDVYDQPARERGRVILTGLGTSPGITNVCVSLLTRRMDTPRRADVCVYQPLNGGGEAVIRHVLFIMSGQVAGFRDGRQQMVRACGSSVRIEFPRFGRVRVWNMGHSEPVTLHRFIPGLEEVRFYMGYGRGSRLFVLPCRTSLFTHPRMLDVVSRLLGKIERFLPAQGIAEGAVRVDVYGERNGREVHEMLCGIGRMREATALSLSVGTLMLARRELCVEGGGAYAPEGGLEPELFLDRLREKGIFAYGDLEMTTRLGNG
ncbi:MAG TPA: saccharopine dehydrogenase NADP-binding domain-containing protein [Candidatus Hydrogenedentes bacterium]|nr:saccharopine dehydrogenase NADP-binding domain-containing protein [Candidatus Hydrogenedentota bacterium]